ncbi:hypothetical protein SS1G_13378, partial [Sclerotinia sclerotiorum 1980 UF-70]
MIKSRGRSSDISLDSGSKTLFSYSCWYEKDTEDVAPTDY